MPKDEINLLLSSKYEASHKPTSKQNEKAIKSSLVKDEMTILLKQRYLPFST